MLDRLAPRRRLPRDGRSCACSGSSAGSRWCRWWPSRRSWRRPRRRSCWSRWCCASGRRRWSPRVATLVLVAVVAPRALGGPSEPEGGDGPRLRVLTANMRFGHGSAAALVALVRRSRADVLSVQELTPDLARPARGGRAGRAAAVARARRRSGRRAGWGSTRGCRWSRAAVIRRSKNPMPVGSLAARGRAAGRHRRACTRSPPIRTRVAQWRRGSARAAAGDAGRRGCGSSRATSTPRSTTPSCGACSTRGYEDAAAEVGAGLHGTWPQRPPLPAAGDDRPRARRRAPRRPRRVDPHDPGTDHRAVLAELELPANGSKPA